MSWPRLRASGKESQGETPPDHDSGRRSTAVIYPFSSDLQRVRPSRRRLGCVVRAVPRRRATSGSRVLHRHRRHRDAPRRSDQMSTRPHDVDVDGDDDGAAVKPGRSEAQPWSGHGQVAQPSRDPDVQHPTLPVMQSRVRRPNNTLDVTSTVSRCDVAGQGRSIRTYDDDRSSSKAAFAAESHHLRTPLRCSGPIAKDGRRRSKTVEDGSKPMGSVPVIHTGPGPTTTSDMAAARSSPNGDQNRSLP